ncbi:hypothetical protein AALP_AAs47492U000400 [Arabis alpina]|uniref:Uncharacterized protein n=1 Tax=Arabis alpina TaxID=50452 RepID=A0A087FWT8_ARAAL|nr:hypothetical protein AALP_AAs47492U000400 [Arabis alpina]
MTYYKHNGDIRTPPSTSGPGGGRHDHGRRLMSIYRPNGDIYTRPSSSGHGGGHIHQHSL